MSFFVEIWTIDFVTCNIAGSSRTGWETTFQKLRKFLYCSAVHHSGWSNELKKGSSTPLVLQLSCSTATCVQCTAFFVINCSLSWLQPATLSCFDHLYQLQLRQQNIYIERSDSQKSVVEQEKWCHNNKHFSELASHHGRKTGDIYRYYMKKLHHCHPMYTFSSCHNVITSEVVT